MKNGYSYGGLKKAIREERTDVERLKNELFLHELSLAVLQRLKREKFHRLAFNSTNERRRALQDEIRKEMESTIHRDECEQMGRIEEKEGRASY